MATLTSKSTLKDLARILYEAALARRMWQKDGEGGGRDMPLGPMWGDIGALFDTIEREKIPYLLVGGVAMLAYVDGRNTLDVDLVVSVSSLAKLPELVVDDRSGDFARGKFRSVRVDLLFTQNPVFKLVQERYAARAPLLGREVSLASAEGLSLLKLYALPSFYRQGNFDRVDLYSNDIAMLVRNRGLNLQPILEVLRQFVTPGEFADLCKEAAGIEARVAMHRQKATG